MTVSIVIPVFNAAQFILETLESVQRQTYADWELILVDDGSADRSVELIRQFISANPGKARLYGHPGGGNRGTSASRNLGLRQATGELVCFLDADDVWKPDFLGYFVDKYDRFPGIDMAYGPFIAWDPAAGPGGDSLPVQNPGVRSVGIIDAQVLFRLFLECENAVPTPSAVMMRRAAVEQAGGWEEVFRGMYDDQVLYSKLFLHGGTVYLSDRPLCYYRQHEASLCRAAVKENRLYQSRKDYLAWLSDYLNGGAGTHDDDLKIVREQRTLLEVRHSIDTRFSTGLSRASALSGVWSDVAKIRQDPKALFDYKVLRYGGGYLLAKLLGL